MTWVGSPNFTPGRNGHNPNWSAADPNSWIVLHTMVGSIASARARFLSPTGGASATYGVGLDGHIEQYVAETNAPWTNGTMAGVGSNLDSITIEHEDGGAYNGPRTPALYEASARLVADIARRRGIPLVHRGAGGGVIGHKECTGSSTACPDSLDIARIIARAVAINHPPVPVKPPAPVVKPPVPPVVKPPATPPAAPATSTPADTVPVVVMPVQPSRSPTQVSPSGWGPVLARLWAALRAAVGR